jgi:hypothetical protein
MAVKTPPGDTEDHRKSDSDEVWIYSAYSKEWVHGVTLLILN